MMPGTYFSVSNFQLIYIMFRPLYWFGVGSTAQPQPQALARRCARVLQTAAGRSRSSSRATSGATARPSTPQDVVFWMNLLKADATSWGGFAPGPGPVPR